MVLKTTTLRDTTLNVSLFGAPIEQGVFETTIRMRRTKDKVTHGILCPETVFLSSLGEYDQPSGRYDFWLDVPTTPDPIVALRVYNPLLHDSERGEVCSPYHEIKFLSTCVLRIAWLLSYLTDVLCMCLNIYALSIAYLAGSGIHVVKSHAQLWLHIQTDIQNSVMSSRYMS